jgi:hypothetical protein
MHYAVPLPRNYNGLVNFMGELWVVGGVANREQPTSAASWRDTSVTVPLNTVHIWTPSTGVWRDGPAMNTKRPRPFPGGPAVVVASGRIWSLAGGHDDARRETVESIGPGEVAWRQEPSLPMPVLSGGEEPPRWCNGATATVLDSTIYMCAEAGFISLDTSVLGGSWLVTLPQHPTAHGTPPGELGQPLSACVVEHSGEVWVLGGAGRNVGDTHIFTPGGGWRVGPSMPTPQAWAAAASHGGHLYVLSGGHKMEFHPDPFAGWGGGSTHYDDRCYRLLV